MSMKGKTLVGLDVHAAQTHAAVLDTLTGELRVKRLVCPPLEVVPFLEGLGPGVRAVYEAGPTGFGLVRVARERGIDLEVVAPGSIPKGSGDRVKTDRRDAARLARLLAAGELRFAFVPSVADERFRDLTRSIEDVRGDLMRARHRLSKFLLRRGQRYGGPGRAWTAAHLRWLRGLSFEDACSQASFADYLAAVELLIARRASLLEALERAVPGSSHALVISRLRCFRGIDTLSAAGLAAEVGDFGRFAKPTLLTGFLGIVPSERTSDVKRRQGSITKTGPPHARRLLVEAAHHYRRRPVIGDTLARRQAGEDPRVIAIAWRAQQRLYQRWQHLRQGRRKPAGVVAIACARELATFLWEAATLD
jgi:transposase